MKVNPKAIEGDPFPGIGGEGVGPTVEQQDKTRQRTIRELNIPKEKLEVLQKVVSSPQTTDESKN